MRSLPAALAALACILSAIPAHAAADVRILDPIGDESLNLPAGMVLTPALEPVVARCHAPAADIVAFGVATNATTLVATLEVRDLSDRRAYCPMLGSVRDVRSTYGVTLVEARASGSLVDHAPTRISFRVDVNATAAAGCGSLHMPDGSSSADCLGRVQRVGDALLLTLPLRDTIRVHEGLQDLDTHPRTYDLAGLLVHADADAEANLQGDVDGIRPTGPVGVFDVAAIPSAFAL